MNLLKKIIWNLQYRFRRLLFVLSSRELVCARCGKKLSRAIVKIDGGKVVLQGLEEQGVYVDFESRNVVVFRHTDQSDCRKHEASS